MGTVDLSKTFRFEAAHRLVHVPDGHKCGRLHGHTWHVTITVRGPVDPDAGWYRDFADIEEAVRPSLNIIDHSYLNEIPGLENPTSEVVAAWLWARLCSKLPGLFEVEVRETPTSVCRYRGETGEDQQG